MQVQINNQIVTLDPSSSIGKGGEADIFTLGNRAVKIFKPPNHIDLKGLPDDQEAAKIRLIEHQHKLPVFPKNLPSFVITPNNLVYDSKKKIIGYTMNWLKGANTLIKLSDKSFRQSGFTNEDVIKTFLNLHKTVKDLHDKKVVIGDFNDLNVLVKNNEAYLIDADSFQFSTFLCKVFTNRFVDPLLCDPKDEHLMLIKAHNENSDWYAYLIMLMQSLLFVGPYGGIYKPKGKKNIIPQDSRPLKRITIFNPEVIYPKPAINFNVLPDDLLQYYYLVFEKDKRDELSIKLLENLNWTKCIVCGEEHARNVCPFCKQTIPVIEVVTIYENVTCDRIFQTKGTILFATYQNERLMYVYFDNDKFLREDGSLVITGKPDKRFKFKILDTSTLIGCENKVIVFENGKAIETLITDTYNDYPVFGTNSSKKFWIINGKLTTNAKVDPSFTEIVGNVLANQTYFWVGETFGFGFYRAGEINISFVFDINQRIINDNVNLNIKGQLIEANCYFAKEKCWFFYSVQKNRKIYNVCVLVNKNGKIETSLEAEDKDGTWLGDGIQGKCAVNDFLLSVTEDEGIVRIEQFGNTLIETKKFIDCKPFVNSHCQLFASIKGLWVVNSKSVSLLKIR